MVINNQIESRNQLIKESAYIASMDKHEIDKRIREELGGLEANPPVEAWLGITDALDQRARKRRLPLFMGMAASLAAIIAVSMSLWLIQPPQEQAFHSATQGWPDHLEGLAAAPLAQQTARSIPESRLVQPRAGHAASAEAFQLPARMQATTGDGLSVETALISSANAPAFAPDLEVDALLAIAEESTDGRFALLDSDPGSATAPGKFSLGVHAAPRQNHRLLARNSDFNNVGIPFESLEDGLMTYGMGMRVSYALNQNIDLQTGMNYIRTGQYVRDIIAYKHPGEVPIYMADRHTGAVYHPQSIITSQGSIRFTDPYHYFADVQSHRVITDKQAAAANDIKSLRQAHEGLTQVFSFLEIPVTFRYQLADGLLGLHLKGGFAGNFLMQNDVFAGKNMQHNAIGETYGIRKFNVSAIGGLAFDVALTGRLTLHMEPTAQIFLNPVLREGMMTGHAFPYSYSIQTGISYDF